MSVKLEFYFDVVCPFAYSASTQVNKLAEKYDVEITWIPVLLGGVYVGAKAPQGANSASTVWSRPKRNWSSRDLLWQCNRYGIVLNKPKKFPVSTLDAMRVLTSLKNNRERV